MVWKEVLNTAKVTGERVIGRGAEVDFRHEISEAVNNGTPKPRAEKEVFLDRVDGVGNEARLSGAVDYRSKNWRDFEAAINELFEDSDKKTFAENSENPLLFRNVAIGPVSPTEYSRANAYFRGKFNGEAPRHFVVNDMAGNVKMMIALVGRIFGELSPFAGNNVDIKAILTAHPEIGADIGMAEKIKQELEKAEERFGREQLHKKVFEQFKEDAGDSLRDMFLGAPMEFLGKMAKTFGRILKNPSQKNVAEGFISFSGAVMRFAAKELLGTAKLAYGGTKTTLLYFNKLRK